MSEGLFTFLRDGVCKCSAVFQKSAVKALALLSRAAPPSFASTDSGRSLDYIMARRLSLDKPVLRTGTWRAEAQAASPPGGPSVCYKVYQNRYHETAEMLYLLSRCSWAAMAKYVEQLIDKKEMHGHMVFMVGQCDEASAKLRVNVGGRGERGSRSSWGDSKGAAKRAPSF